jgi:ABC-type antimicrobial peptide transport system permease subunit
MVLLAHTAGDSAPLPERLRDLLQRIDPDVPVTDVQTMETFYDIRIRIAGTILLRLVSAMGFMGMTLTMVGLYGLVSYAVSRRTREIGIRIAIGATYARIVRMILRQGMTPAWVGMLAGLLLSLTTVRLLSGLVPLMRTVEPATYYLVVPLIFLVTLAAAFVPARRAARINPTVALRCE